MAKKTLEYKNVPVTPALHKRLSAMKRPTVGGRKESFSEVLERALPKTTRRR